MLLYIIGEVTSYKKVTLRTIILWGCLGSSVSWGFNSWFQLRLWSLGGGIQPCVGLCAEHGGCLGFSLSPSVPFPCLHACSLSQNKQTKTRLYYNLLSYLFNVRLLSYYTLKVLAFLFSSFNLLYLFTMTYYKYLCSMYLQIYSIPREVLNTYLVITWILCFCIIFNMGSKMFSILFGIICEYL